MLGAMPGSLRDQRIEQVFYVLRVGPRSGPCLGLCVGTGTDHAEVYGPYIGNRSPRGYVQHRAIECY